MQFTFEQLPQAVNQLYDKLNDIEKLLLSNGSDKQEHDQLLTIQQAGELLNLSVPTLYGLNQRSEIPVYKRGKRLYFSKQNLLNWIKEGRKKTASEIKNETEKNADAFLVSKQKKEGNKL